jgi:hypothetical protein
MLDRTQLHFTLPESIVIDVFHAKTGTLTGTERLLLQQLDPFALVMDILRRLFVFFHRVDANVPDFEEGLYSVFTGTRVPALCSMCSESLPWLPGVSDTNCHLYRAGLDLLPIPPPPPQLSSLIHRMVG